MAQYFYRGTEMQTRKMRMGRGEFKTKYELEMFLIEQGILPSYSVEIPWVFQSFEGLLKQRFPNKLKKVEVAFFCDQLGMLIEAGVPIIESLYLIIEMTNAKKLKVVMIGIAEEVRKGYLLSEAMGKLACFPEVCVGMITSGEISGKLGTSLLRVSAYYEKQLKLYKKIEKAIFYPIIMVVVMLVACSMMMCFILPRFVQLFDSLEGELPVLTRMMMKMHNDLKQYCVQILACMSVLTAGMYAAFVNKIGKSKWDKIKMYIPGINQIIILKTSHFFCDTFGSLIASGVPIIKSLEITRMGIQNYVMDKELETVINLVLSGCTLGGAFKQSKIWPVLLKNMLETGEHIGQLDEILPKISSYYYNLLEAKLEKKILLIEPILTLGIGAAVAVMMLAVMLPMYTLATQISW